MITLSADVSGEPIRTDGRLRRLGKGSAVYHQGDPASHWYEVVSGIVRTCRFQGSGHRQLTGFYYGGDVFGLDAGSYCESAEAVTDAVLRSFATGNFDEGTGTHIRDRVLGKALESARRSIFLLGHRTAANRVAAFLIAVAERSGISPGVKLPMTRGDIADHLNLTLHTVSRTMSEFARKGLIALDGPQDVRILDLEALQATAGEAEGATASRGSAPRWDGLCQSGTQ
jgi:CRP/FNR family transcriptional regulator/CRP/FNR family nitrogen fixation transcriptional regulator